LIADAIGHGTESSGYRGLNTADRGLHGAKSESRNLQSEIEWFPIPNSRSEKRMNDVAGTGNGQQQRGRGR
jgi:hypothetical protein